MANYRKIWEDANGPIPKDELGRSYEIHHIDGNRKNNDLSNLMCVSIQEHYDIHLKQHDHFACLIISSRMEISPEEKSRFSKLAILESKKNGNFFAAIEKAKKTKKINNSAKIAAIKSFQTKVDRGIVEDIYRRIAQKRKINGTNKINGIQKRYRCILQYDMFGNFIKEWSSISEARKYCGGAPHKAADGKQKQSNGFIWKWKN